VLGAGGCWACPFIDIKISTHIAQACISRLPRVVDRRESILPQT
jgi:hypothetical protein